MPVCEKEGNERPGTQRPASFIPVARKIPLKIIKQSIYKHLVVMKNSRRGFDKNKSCQASFIFYSERTTGRILTWGRLFLLPQRLSRK